MPKTIRVWFKKDGRAKYISHLDVSRCMSRALRRAKLPVWYTEGFNPHLFTTFALPLSLGVEGDMESMDVKLLDDELSPEEFGKRLNAVLPEGIEVADVTLPIMKPSDIARAEYEAILPWQGEHTSYQQKISDFLQSEKIMVTKHGKQGDREIDIKPAILSCRQEQAEDGVHLFLVLPAGTQENINPALLLDCMLKDWEAPPCYQLRRHKIMNESGDLFR